MVGFSLIGGVSYHAVLWDQGTVTDLGGLPGTGYNNATGINDRGQIVGTSGSDAVVWERGSLIDLGPGSGTAINNRSQVVGSSPGAGLGAALWDHGTLIPLGGLPRSPSQSAAAINEHGRIVGTTMNQYALHATRAVLWDSGTITDLGTLTGKNSAAPSGINDRGQIVGSVYDAYPSKANNIAAVWDHGSIVDLGMLPDATTSAAAAINNRGQIVGSSDRFYGSPSPTIGNGHATLWEHGMLIDLGDLPGAQYSVANAINERGQVVGISFSGLSWHAVLWKVTYDSLCGLSREVVSNASMANGMCTLLEAAKRNEDRGLSSGAGSLVEAYGRMVDAAQRAGFVSATNAIILKERSDAI
jgi:probable HAF family extracellular repeat protein